MAKERLDVLLVERNLAESRERAKITIMEGLVLVNGQKVDKAGTMVKPDAEIRILGNTLLISGISTRISIHICFSI